MSLLPDLPAGIYRHFKGGLYQVLGYGHDNNFEERGPVVVYIPLELNPEHTGPRLGIRTAVSDNPDVTAWWDLLHLDGTKCMAATSVSEPSCGRDPHVQQPRFEYLGTGYEPGMSR